MNERNELAMDAQKRVGGVRAKHEAAYRRRMGMVGVLSCCVCLYPLEMESTQTGHSPFCPAHAMLARRKHACLSG